MTELPQLPREPIRPDKEPNSEGQEIWKPDWQCFCCHDFGTVHLPLIFHIISDYDKNRDKPIRCQHPRCESGKLFAGNCNYDQRFIAAICVELDKIERRNWQDYIDEKRSQIALKKSLENLVKTKTMPGSKTRTTNDNREVEQRKAEIEAITHEQWIAQGQKYFDGHLDEYAEDK